MKIFKFKKKMNKKGQVFESLGELGVGIATLTILLVVAFLIMSQGKEQVVDTITESTFTNNTLTVVLDQFVPLPCLTTETLTVVQAYNGTGGSTPVAQIGLLNPGTTNKNYTIVNHQVNFSDDNLGDHGALPTSLNVTFSCKQPDSAYNGTSTLQDATNDIPGWVPLIVVAVIGVLLLSLVALFRRNQ